MYTDVAYRHQSHVPPNSPSQIPPDPLPAYHSSARNYRSSLRPHKVTRSVQPMQSTSDRLLKSSSSYGSRSYMAEHMLRRKTPNGTLAAGYDGRPIEWASRRPPSKHFLIPAPNTAEDAFCQHQAHYKESCQTYEGPPTLPWSIDQPAPYKYDHQRVDGHKQNRLSSDENWQSQVESNAKSAPIPGLDSVLYQDDPPDDLCPSFTSSDRNESQITNIQFKDQILFWAHRVYMSLLSSRQQARQTGSNVQHPSSRHPKDHAFQQVSPAKFPNTQDFSHRQSEDGLNLYQSTPVSYKDNSLIPSQSLVDNHLFDFDFHSHEALKPRNIISPYRSTTHLGKQMNHDSSPTIAAVEAIELLSRLAQQSDWKWTDGMLLGGCLAYGLGDYSKALNWYSKVLLCDSHNVEALSNLAATLLSLGRRQEAEEHWLRAVELRPSYFEAVEHLVGIYCEDHRGREAVSLIEFVERSLQEDDVKAKAFPGTEFSLQHRHIAPNSHKTHSVTGYSILSSENGRMLSLIHGKGNMLYALGDNAGAAKAFENAILIGSGQRHLGIRSLIGQILRVFARQRKGLSNNASDEPILLMPDDALETSKLVFPPYGNLPGLEDVPTNMARRAGISIVSNSLLSLAKIYQDGMSSSGATANGPRATSGVQEILALYYLSLSLQPSPSTANNVGILLAGVQQTSVSATRRGQPSVVQGLMPGVVPGSGIQLALAYYHYGLNLDSRHAHLYTNLGSLFKDVGQLSAAIKMYEKAVHCDGSFDIALANLANAVKDQGRISDAIDYYRRAVIANPEFAEAVCGLANALNSVCNWHGRGGVKILGPKRDRWHVDEKGMLYDGYASSPPGSGWIERVVAIVDKQLREGEGWGRGVLQSIQPESFVRQLRLSDSTSLANLIQTLRGWASEPWEGARVVRLIERATKRLGWQYYRNEHVDKRPNQTFDRTRPQLPAALAVPSAPTVLPFHTFTCPLSARQIRKISQRNGLRISCSTLRAAWLPRQIYGPPSPPNPHLNVGYVSSDFNNHPLAHLMQSIFGLHDNGRVRAICYATTASDGSVHRQQIEREAPTFHDASAWSIDRLVDRIVDDGVHILVNLNGYTRGAKNEVFAARPAPVQMSFMGFAGTLGAEWCDYLLADKIAIPPQTLRPVRQNVDLVDQTMDGNNNDDDHAQWIYGENIIFTRDTFFCCDHRQSAPDAREPELSWAEEQKRRWRMRKELFPSLPDDAIILGNFNQLYKIEPTTFRTWLRILSRTPKAVLWLLRFPDLGETNLRETAMSWVGAEVASRVIFTDVAPKHQHISRARICDLFLDTPECNAHTTAADVLWSGTPLLTFPRNAEGDRARQDLIVDSDEGYEERAVELATDLIYPNDEGKGLGRLMELRKLLYTSRWTSALFDTRRWVRDLEEAYEVAWKRWVAGEGGDIWL
ncbi:MAG: hypothetical protein Q9223_006891 [Gallowayella weberi]